MRTSKLLRVALAALIGIASTAAAGLGVWSATQNTLTATDSVNYIADKYVDATVVFAINGTDFATKTFSSVDNSDDTQTLDLPSMVATSYEDNSAYWIAVDKSGYTSDIDRDVTFTVTITNTSDYYALNTKCSRTGGSNDGTEFVITEDANNDTTVKLNAKNSTSVLTYNFYTKGYKDVTEFVNKFVITLDAITRE